MPACWIALGGNIGDVSDTFRRALAILVQTPDVAVVRTSGTYTTSPVGAESGGQFLNSAAELRTTRTPVELLKILQQVETQLGRVRTRHWGPRTLDLDLLLYDQQCLETPELTIPHPHLWYRRFVMDPLVEIAPDVVHPVHQRSIRDLRERLLHRPLSCRLVGGDDAWRSELQQRLAGEFPQVEWATDPASQGWLQFLVDARPPDLQSHPNWIELRTFPTSPEQTMRDVLGAALDDVRKRAD